MDRHRTTASLSGGRPLAGLLLVSAVLAVPGCTKRHQLGETDLPEVGSASMTDVRVYPSRRTVVLYEETIEPAPGKTVLRLKIVLTRNTRGAVVSEDALDGKRRLWVSFDPTCHTPECAYGFVRGDGERFELASKPPIEGFAPTTEPSPVVYLEVDESTLAPTASLARPQSAG